jgi:hypothetical protein
MGRACGTHTEQRVVHRVRGTQLQEATTCNTWTHVGGQYTSKNTCSSNRKEGRRYGLDLLGSGHADVAGSCEKVMNEFNMDHVRALCYTK